MSRYTHIWTKHKNKTKWGLLVLCAIVAVFLIIRKILSTRSGNGDKEQPDSKLKRPDLIQVRNASKQTMWIAYMCIVTDKSTRTNGYNGGWPTYSRGYVGTKYSEQQNSKDSDSKISGSIRVDHGQSVFFPGGDKMLESGRIWPMLGCNDKGKFCKVGCSSGGETDDGKGLSGSGYIDSNNQGFIYTRPIDSKFEFTIEDGVKGADWFNMSSVDGVTLWYDFEFTVTDGYHKVTNRLGPADCPKEENILKKNGGVFDNIFTINLNYKDTEDRYLGCSGPCAYLTSGNKYNFPFCDQNAAPSTRSQCCPYNSQNSFPPSNFYCCQGDAATSAACNAGPINGTEWCRKVHSQGKIKDWPDKSKIDTPGIYCQAYDDATGLLNSPSHPDNKYKITFYDNNFEWTKQA